MKKMLIGIALSLGLFSGIFASPFLLHSRDVYAARKPGPPASTNVSATIGTYYLSVSGYIAPYASLVLIINDFALKSTVADAQGYFSLDNIIVDKNITKYCIDAVDVRRLGESYTCITIPPITDNIHQTNIFLPPTLGVERTQVTVGDQAIIWGYSMPGAKVVVHISDGRTITVQADDTGFYEAKTVIQKVGQYELFADATYKAANSLVPDRTTKLVAISKIEQIAKVSETALEKVLKRIFGGPWWFVWLIIPILILIIILLKKLSPSLGPLIERKMSDLANELPFFPHRLHHWWMDGVGF